MIRAYAWITVALAWAPGVVSASETTTMPPQTASVAEKAVIVTVAAQEKQIITITSGGGSKINDRVVALFSKTKWRFDYSDAPGIAQHANQVLEADGYDVTPSGQRPPRMGWQVQTVVIGDPQQYAPPGDGKEEASANVERVGRVVGGILMGILSGGRIDGGRIAGGDTANNPYAKYITKEMVSGLPPGAKKVLLTRLVNPVYRSSQEILTVAYTDVSDDELRRINAGPLLEMIGITYQHGEKHAKVIEAVAGNVGSRPDADGVR